MKRIFNNILKRHNSYDDSMNATNSSLNSQNIQKKQQWKMLFSLMNTYSFESLISALRRLADYLMKNGINSGNIFIKILSFPALLAAIILLQTSLLIKRFFKNAYRIFKNILKFFNMLLTILVEEIKYYWKRAYKAGCELIECEKYLYKKMIEHCQTLWNEIFNEVAAITLQYAQRSYRSLLMDVIRKFGYWIGTVVLAIVMTIILVALPFIIPLSIRLRGGKMNDNDEEIVAAN